MIVGDPDEFLASLGIEVQVVGDNSHDDVAETVAP